MLILNVKRVVLLLSLCFVVSCSDKNNDKSEAKKDVEVKQQATELKEEQADTKSEVTKVDIMTPLDGTDPCFTAVELLRTEGDVAMFKELGDSIILNSAEVATDSHRTYMGIIGAGLKENKSIAEIRQVLLDKCRLLKKK